jgi:hypothetical protein
MYSIYDITFSVIGDVGGQAPRGKRRLTGRFVRIEERQGQLTESVWCLRHAQSVKQMR